MAITPHEFTQPESAVVFVTGANGFVGSHLVRSLIGKGHRVRALVRPRADRSLVADLPIDWIVGDLDDGDALCRGCDGTDWVVHAAGRVKAPDSEAFHHANQTGTANILKAVSDVAPALKRFVYVSSLAAGGPVQNGRPRTESDPDLPITPYGESKLAGERTAMAYADRFPVVSIRPPAVYGPGDTEVLGFFKAVRWHVKPVFGGRRLRLSLVYVSDLVDGILLALSLHEASGEVFYISDDRVYSLVEIEEMMQEALGNWAITVKIPGPVLRALAYSAEIVGRIGGFVPSLNRNRARDFLQRDWACVPEKAQRLLGFQSQVDFAEGAKKTVEWYLEHRWL